MSDWFRKPLTRTEIFSHFLWLAGFVTYQVHGPHDGLRAAAIAIMVVGGAIAIFSRSKSPSAEATDESIESESSNPAVTSLPAPPIDRIDQHPNFGTPVDTTPQARQSPRRTKLD